MKLEVGVTIREDSSSYEPLCLDEKEEADLAHRT